MIFKNEQYRKHLKIVSIIGARPQFVKEAVIQHEFKKYSDIQEIVVHTGQHYDENMSEIFFETLSMSQPQYNLSIQGGTHGQMTGMMLVEIEKLLIDEKPDLVIVYGDTNSTLAGSLAAKKLNIPVAHIEAGLRQEPKSMPEETNRVVTDHVSTYLFTPTENGAKTLENEGIVDNVYFTGDIMYDVFVSMKKKFTTDIIEKVGLEKNNFVLMTLHRDFNVDEKARLESILSQINKINEEVKVVYSIHPRTKARVQEYNLEAYLKDLIVLEPLPYTDLMALARESKFAITDSGGFQKESYFSGKQALVIMPDTGWIELVDEGINLLTEPEDIYSNYLKLGTSNFKEGIYGNGDASRIIVDVIRKEFLGG